MDRSIFFTSKRNLSFLIMLPFIDKLPLFPIWKLAMEENRS
jgi:hypothetical protein